MYVCSAFCLLLYFPFSTRRVFEYVCALLYGNQEMQVGNLEAETTRRGLAAEMLHQVPLLALALGGGGGGVPGALPATGDGHGGGATHYHHDLSIQLGPREQAASEYNVSRLEIGGRPAG